MTDKKLTPEQFVKEWLPEYEGKIDEYNSEILKHYPDANHEKMRRLKILGPDEVFIDKHFPEALEAYARHVHDQACERQREECAKNLTGYDGEHVPDELSAKILSAPAPKLKLTEKE